MEGGYSLALLQDDITREDMHMRASVPPGKRLAVTLQFLAKGNTYMDTADMFGLGTSTVSYILHETVGVLNHHFFAREVRFPVDGQEPEQVMIDFQDICRLPQCVGAIDGCLIPMQAPTGLYRERYVSYKNFLLPSC